MTTSWDVIVVGAGLAGLTAGATAAQGGARTLVLETARPGGRARVTERAGVVFNLGPHALYRGGEAHAVLRRLGVRPSGVKPPLHRYEVVSGGARHRLPTGPTSLLTTGALGSRSKARLSALLGRLPAMKASSVGGLSVDEWVADHSLRPDAEAVLRALVRLSTYADDTATLSAEAAVLQLQRGATRGVLYLHGGWSQLTDGLARSVEVRRHVSARGVEGGDGRVVVHTGGETLTARAVVVAAGTPAAARGLLGRDPGWGDLGPAVTGACLDVATRTQPEPGYVLGADEPVYATTVSPPARGATGGRAAVSLIRYGARSAAEDRPLLAGWLSLAGVGPDDVVASRFLARLTVTATAPLARRGGLVGRPPVDATGLAGVFVAGDWVGRHGLLADAAVASGHEAGLAALRTVERSSRLVA